MTRELLPCPCCGGDKVRYLQDRNAEYFVLCPTVGGCGISTGHSPSKEVVREIWNRRALASPEHKISHAVGCKKFPDPYDEREPKGPCTCGAESSPEPPQDKSVMTDADGTTYTLVKSAPEPAYIRTHLFEPDIDDEPTLCKHCGCTENHHRDASPEPEPVAWACLCQGQINGNLFPFKCDAEKCLSGLNKTHPGIDRSVIPLYTSALCGRQGWQKIASAPKNGKMILVCLPSQGNLIVRSRYDRVHEYWLTDYKGEGGISRPHFYHHGDMWLPLPPPPVRDEE